MGLTFLHVFPFSARAGTPAARMPQVPGEVRCERAARLREAGDRALTAYLAAQVGSTAEVLVESGEEGRTPHYARVRLAGVARPGAFVEVHLAEARGDHLLGVPLS
jgi:threonylcarbamoyladenosine tRNA methylthiotransferase MtaB